mgnify:CR=1 FL=1
MYVICLKIIKYVLLGMTLSQIIDTKNSVTIHNKTLKKMFFLGFKKYTKSADVIINSITKPCE